MKSYYLRVYESMCPDDPIDPQDSRRDDIIAEMRAIRAADTDSAAAKVIEWWFEHEQAPRRLALAWVRKARKLMRVLEHG